MADKERQNHVGRLLAGDMGATKTNLALFTAGKPLRDFTNEATLIGEEHATALEALQGYLHNSGAQATHGCFGVAGPVFERHAHLSNLDWTLDAAELEKRLGFERVWLLNDLQATAQAVPILEKDEVETLNTGQPVADGVIGVIAPGTGLGIGFLTKDEDGYTAHAAEGGHADFAPADELQVALLEYLQPRLPHVSLEVVCSGLGLPNVYRFLRDSGRCTEPDWLREQLDAIEHPTPLIVETALGEKQAAEISRQALQLFVDILAAAAGNLALTIGATGGIYLGGGIPPRILPLLKAKRFLEHYSNKAGFEDYLGRVPVHVILNSDAALLGAADYGLRRMAAPV